MNNTIFRPGWFPTLLTAALIPTFCALGVWQMHRAEEKHSLMAQQQSRAQLPEIAVSAEWTDQAALRYRPASAEGSYDSDHQFLLDNQIFDRQAGFQVLTPLRLKNTDLAVMVNRGWIPHGTDRSHLPNPAAPSGTLRIAGVIDRFPRVGLKLQGMEIPTPGWPALIQLADPEQLAARLGYRILPYQVLLAPGEAGGFQRAWRQADLHPETSEGYALQWFSFAATVFLLYLWYGFKKPQAPAGSQQPTEKT